MIKLQLLSLLLFSVGVDSWSNKMPSITHRRNTLGRLEAKESNVDDGDVVIPKAEYGVSYIGGDPCGSKYNSDPFDSKVSKPGMPDDMKSRIQALAEQKIKAMKEAEKDSE